jgi:small subunit ribosomal protein S17
MENNKKKKLEGTVVSNKMQKTIVVEIKRKVQHPVYKKYTTQVRRYKVHDENGLASIGDRVAIVQTRPISRHKRWALVKVLRKANPAVQENIEH